MNTQELHSTRLELLCSSTSSLVFIDRYKLSLLFNNFGHRKIYISEYQHIGTIKPTYWYNMITEKQLRVLGLFTKNIFSEYTFKDLFINLKEKSNNFIQLSIKKFLSENLIQERSVGTSKLYKINTDNTKVYEYISMYAHNELTKPANESIKTLIEHLDKKMLFYSLVLFGSFAIGEQKKDSDLDIAIIVPDKNLENELK